ncbi:MAG: hypothetical protein NTX98_01940 [Candidatus Doudnabacteria bacterium]|nr:hypothetical protein [Candidatus Doudnabacteria bacterium]
MFKTLKLTLYLIILVVIIFLYWFLPKYSYIHKNPGSCVILTKSLYYCGNDAGLDKLFDITK